MTSALAYLFIAVALGGLGTFWLLRARKDGSNERENEHLESRIEAAEEARKIHHRIDTDPNERERVRRKYDQP